MSRDPGEIKTGTKLDNIGVGEEIEKIPSHVIGVDWPSDAYTRPVSARYDIDGEIRERLLLDFDLLIDDVLEDEIKLSINGLGITCQLSFSPFGWPYYSTVGEQREISLIRGFTSESLLDYLNSHPLSIYLPDFSRIEGEEKFGPPERNSVPRLQDDRYEIIDWETEEVDIEREFSDDEKGLYPRNGHVSIHDYLSEALLRSEETRLVFYDHTQGEAADFITIAETADDVFVSLYHCKSSGGEKAGARVNDIYEICGQAIKSLRYLGDLNKLAEHIKRRRRELSLPEYMAGSDDQLDDLVAQAREIGSRFQVALVQPGISKKKCLQNLRKKQYSLAAIVIFADREQNRF